MTKQTSKQTNNQMNKILNNKCNTLGKGRSIQKVKSLFLFVTNILIKSTETDYWIGCLVPQIGIKSKSSLQLEYDWLSRVRIHFWKLNISGNIRDNQFSLNCPITLVRCQKKQLSESAAACINVRSLSVRVGYSERVYRPNSGEDQTSAWKKTINYNSMHLPCIFSCGIKCMILAG